MSTYEEWRVTGTPGKGYPPYSFTWSPGVDRFPRADDPEREARGFVALFEDSGTTWADGPHLHKRTVTVTDWEPA